MPRVFMSTVIHLTKAAHGQLCLWTAVCITSASLVGELHFNIEIYGLKTPKNSAGSVHAQSFPI